MAMINLKKINFSLFSIVMYSIDGLTVKFKFTQGQIPVSVTSEPNCEPLAVLPHGEKMPL